MNGGALRQLQELAHPPPEGGGASMFESAAPEGMFGPPVGAAPGVGSTAAPAPPLQGGGGGARGDIEQGVVPTPDHGPTLQSHFKSVVRITVIAGALALLAWAIKVFFGAKGAHRAKPSEKMRDFVYEMDAMAQGTDSEDEGEGTAGGGEVADTEAPETPQKERRKKSSAAKGGEAPGSTALDSDPLYCFFEAIP